MAKEPLLLPLVVPCEKRPLPTCVPMASPLIPPWKAEQLAFYCDVLQEDEGCCWLEADCSTVALSYMLGICSGESSNGRRQLPAPFLPFEDVLFC